MRRLATYRAVLQTESAAKDTNRGVIPMLLYCDTTQVPVKQLKCDTYYCTQCRGAVRITQLLVLIEQHLKVKHRVRHHTAYSAEDTSSIGTAANGEYEC